MGSLLGQFYSRIRGSQEDVASAGLAYILDRSLVARTKVKSIVETKCGVALPDLRFSSQVAGENQARPDISAFDSQRVERMILEAKFWAALTDNQPIEYLNRLGHGGVLLFVCPRRRERLLWDELVRRLTDNGIAGEFNHEERVVRLGQEQVLAVLSWGMILDSLREELMQAGETRLVSDLDQVIGLCQVVDESAFAPITENDLSVALGRRISSFYTLIDKTIEELGQRVTISLEGLRPSPYRGGYVRYFTSAPFAFGLYLDFENWHQFGETPLWLGIKDIATTDWGVTPELWNKVNGVAGYNNRKAIDIKGDPYFPLFPKLGVEEDVVVSALATDIKQIIELLHTCNQQSVSP